MTSGGAKRGGLHVTESGAGVPLLLLHGFTGSADTWRSLQDAWPGVRLLAADLPGHGRSLGVDASIPATIDALLAAMDDRGVSRFALLGYSMGGRVALRLALRAPQRITALVLESTSPGIATPGTDGADARADRVAADRVAADRAQADRIEREGIEAFVDHWQSLPLWASQAQLSSADRAALRAQRLRNDAAGLAASLRAAGAGAVLPVLNDLPSLRMPALVVAGALDAAYCEHARAMADRLPQARLAIVPEAGHAVHLERPRRFREAVGAFLRGAGGAAAAASD